MRHKNCVGFGIIYNTLAVALLWLSIQFVGYLNEIHVNYDLAPSPRLAFTRRVLAKVSESHYIVVKTWLGNTCGCSSASTMPSAWLKRNNNKWDMWNGCLAAGSVYGMAGRGSWEWCSSMWSQNSQQLKVKGAITQRDIKANGCGLSFSLSAFPAFPSCSFYVCMNMYVDLGWEFCCYCGKDNALTHTHLHIHRHIYTRTHRRMQPCRAKPNRAENEMENIAMRKAAK